MIHDFSDDGGGEYKPVQRIYVDSGNKFIMSCSYASHKNWYGWKKTQACF